MTDVPLRARATLLLSTLTCLLVAFACAGPTRANGYETLVASNGFDTLADGFSFPNYSIDEGYAGLNAAEMQKLFGNRVCLSNKGGKCVLSSVARSWMEAINGAMDVGLCYGFAGLSELIYTGNLPAFGYSSFNAFGPAAENPFELRIDNNVKLQRSIARAWTYQQLPAVAQKTKLTNGLKTVNQLIDWFREKPNEPVQLIMTRLDMSSGHAVTPYRITESDDEYEYRIYVYDSNWPGDTSRYIKVSKLYNIWSYYAGNFSDPERRSDLMYRGMEEHKNIGIAPIAHGLGVQPCPFCAGRKGRGSKYNEITLDGAADSHSRIMIVDNHGRKTGYQDGKIFNQIPGAQIQPRIAGEAERGEDGDVDYLSSLEPVYRIPAKRKIKVTISGKYLEHPTTEYLTFIGPDIDVTAEKIRMERRDEATVSWRPEWNRKRRNEPGILTLTTSKRSKPIATIGQETKKAAFQFTFSAQKKSTALSLLDEDKLKSRWIHVLPRRFGKSQKITLNVKRYTKRGASASKRTVKVKRGQELMLDYRRMDRAKRANGRILIYTPPKKHKRARKHWVRVPAPR